MRDQVVPVLTLVGLAFVLWLLLIRPAQRRNRELAHLQSTLEVGDEVMLTSGVYGVLRSIDDTEVRVEVAEGVVLRVARGAVRQLVAEPDAHPDTGTDTGTGTGIHITDADTDAPPDTAPDDRGVSEEN